jgi:hypothetical protein
MNKNSNEARPGFESEQPSSPDPGKLLASFRRSESEELRVELMTFKGSPFVSVRMYRTGWGGKWWPTTKGTSIRIKEIKETVSALQRAADMASAGRHAPCPPDRRDFPKIPRRNLVPPWLELPELTPDSGSGDFDEFDEGASTEA